MCYPRETKSIIITIVIVIIITIIIIVIIIIVERNAFLYIVLVSIERRPIYFF